MIYRKFAKLLSLGQGAACLGIQKGCCPLLPRAGLKPRPRVYFVFPFHYRLSMEKILIIDHDEAELHRWADYLKQKGFVTLTATTGGEGLENIRRENPNIVILDKQLPDTDGLTLLPRIHQEHKEACVVLVTSFHDMETVISARQRGAFLVPRKDHIGVTRDRMDRDGISFPTEE